MGRERERASVRALYEEVAAEGVARVALVTAPPGLGKTRLAFELGRQLAAKPHARAAPLRARLPDDRRRAVRAAPLAARVLRGVPRR